ncbi:MAG TPA: hypothetical protein VHN77_12505 [Phycisphaerales bacterium]|nr:hypothetical protein [Phycisphaerales bacterium]
MKLHNLLRPSGITVKDDRDKSVPVFDWTTAPAAIKEDPQLAGIQARLHTLGSPGFTRPLTRTVTAWMVAVTIVNIVGGILLSKLGMPAWVLFAGVGLVYMLVVSRGHRYEFRSEVVTLLLSHARCGSCGYTLNPAGREADDCTVCAECGAAWKSFRVGTRAVPQRISQMTSARKAQVRTVDGRTMAIDARDQFVPLKTVAEIRELAAPASRLEECAVSVRTTLRWAALRDAGLMLLVNAGIAVGAVLLRPKAWGWNSNTIVWCIFMVGMSFGLARWIMWFGGTFRAATPGAARALIKTMLHHGFCPSCAAEIHPSIRDRAGNLACTKCDATWPSRETDL